MPNKIFVYELKTLQNAIIYKDIFATKNTEIFCFYTQCTWQFDAIFYNYISRTMRLNAIFNILPL